MRESLASPRLCLPIRTFPEPQAFPRKCRAAWHRRDDTQFSRPLRVPRKRSERAACNSLTFPKRSPARRLRFGEEAPARRYAVFAVPLRVPRKRSERAACRRQDVPPGFRRGVRRKKGGENQTRKRTMVLLRLTEMSLLSGWAQARPHPRHRDGSSHGTGSVRQAPARRRGSGRGTEQGCCGGRWK